MPVSGHFCQHVKDDESTLTSPLLALGARAFAFAPALAAPLGTDARLLALPSLGASPGSSCGTTESKALLDPPSQTGANSEDMANQHNNEFTQTVGGFRQTGCKQQCVHAEHSNNCKPPTSSAQRQQLKFRRDPLPSPDHMTQKNCLSRNPGACLPTFLGHIDLN